MRKSSSFFVRRDICITHRNSTTSIISKSTNQLFALTAFAATHWPSDCFCQLPTFSNTPTTICDDAGVPTATGAGISADAVAEYV